MPFLFVYKDKQIIDPREIANRFCEYFTNVGPSLANKLPDSGTSHDSYLTNRISETIFCNPVTVTELKEIASSFKTGNACGFDRIKLDDIKCNIDSVAAPLAHTINQFISTGIVPNDIKIARVIPIYKKDEQSHFENYRPISILPVFQNFLKKQFIIE